MNPQDQNLEAKHSKDLLKKFTKYCMGIAIFMAMGWWITTYTQFLETASYSLERVRYLLVLKSSLALLFS